MCLANRLKHFTSLIMFFVLFGSVSCESLSDTATTYRSFDQYSIALSEEGYYQSSCEKDSYNSSSNSYVLSKISFIEVTRNSICLQIEDNYYNDSQCKKIKIKQSNYQDCSQKLYRDEDRENILFIEVKGRLNPKTSSFMFFKIVEQDIYFAESNNNVLPKTLNLYTFIPINEDSADSTDEDELPPDELPPTKPTIVVYLTQQSSYAPTFKAKLKDGVYSSGCGLQHTPSYPYDQNTDMILYLYKSVSLTIQGSEAPTPKLTLSTRYFKDAECKSEYQDDSISSSVQDIDVRYTIKDTQDDLITLVRESPFDNLFVKIKNDDLYLSTKQDSLNLIFEEQSDVSNCLKRYPNGCLDVIKLSFQHP